MSVSIGHFVWVISDGKVANKALVKKLDGYLDSMIGRITSELRDLDKKLPPQQTRLLRTELDRLNDTLKNSRQISDLATRCEQLENGYAASKKTLEACLYMGRQGEDLQEQAKIMAQLDTKLSTFAENIAQLQDARSEKIVSETLANWQKRRAEVATAGDDRLQLAKALLEEISNPPLNITLITDLGLNLAQIVKLNPWIGDAKLRKIAAKKLTELKKQRDKLADLGDRQTQDLANEVKDWVEWSYAAIRFGEDECRRKRNEVRRDAPTYQKNGKILAKDDNPEKQALGIQLVDLARKMQDQRRLVEKISEQDPAKAMGQEFTVLNKLINDANALFYNAVVMPAINKLIADSPDGAEARMQDAVGGDFESLMKLAYKLLSLSSSPEIGLLSPGEAMAIYNYTSYNYEDMNKLLFGGKIDGDETVRRKIEIQIEETKKALDKLPDHQIKPTLRCEKRWNGDSRQYTDGNEFTAKAFWSTGTGRGSFPGYWRITVYGKSGKDICQISNSRDEYEILFRPGTRFKVKSVNLTEGNGFVVVEEV